MSDDFYLRYYSGHQGKYGHEFLEFEVHSDGRLRYANGSKYKKERVIKKQASVSKNVLEELIRIIHDSEILQENDSSWPPPDRKGKQELEIVLGKEHISFQTSKIGSSVDIVNSQDPDGLKVFHYLTQDLRTLVITLISMHFKIKPLG